MMNRILTFFLLCLSHRQCRYMSEHVKSNTQLAAACLWPANMLPLSFPPRTQFHWVSSDALHDVRGAENMFTSFKIESFTHRQFLTVTTLHWPKRRSRRRGEKQRLRRRRCSTKIKRQTFAGKNIFFEPRISRSSSLPLFHAPSLPLPNSYHDPAFRRHHHYVIDPISYSPPFPDPCSYHLSSLIIILSFFTLTLLMPPSS